MGFNQPVDNLPISLKMLELGWYFNQPVDNLPDSLIDLKFNWIFKQKINRYPSSLKRIMISEKYFNIFPENIQVEKC